MTLTKRRLSCWEGMGGRGDDTLDAVYWMLYTGCCMKTLSSDEPGPHSVIFVLFLTHLLYEQTSGTKYINKIDGL